MMKADKLPKKMIGTTAKVGIMEDVDLEKAEPTTTSKDDKEIIDEAMKEDQVELAERDIYYRGLPNWCCGLLVLVIIFLVIGAIVTLGVRSQSVVDEDPMTSWPTNPPTFYIE